MSKEKPTLLDDLLEPLRDWRNIGPGILVLPGCVLIFVGAAAFLLMRFYQPEGLSLGAQVVLWIVELGFVLVGWALAIFGFAAKSWPGQRRV